MANDEIQGFVLLFQGVVNSITCLGLAAILHVKETK